MSLFSLKSIFLRKSSLPRAAAVTEDGPVLSHSIEQEFAASRADVSAKRSAQFAPFPYNRKE